MNSTIIKTTISALVVTILMVIFLISATEGLRAAEISKRAEAQSAQQQEAAGAALQEWIDRYMVK